MADYEVFGSGDGQDFNVGASSELIIDLSVVGTSGPATGVVSAANAVPNSIVGVSGPATGVVVVSQLTDCQIVGVSGAASGMVQIGQFAILQVGVNNIVTQGQQAVNVALDGFTGAIATVTLNGVGCTIRSQTANLVVVDIPMSLASGVFTMQVNGITAGEFALTTVTYVQTHPLAAPAPGTVIPGSGSTDPGRALIFGIALSRNPYVAPGDLPVGLSFKAPHTGWTQSNIALPLTQVVESDPQLPEGLSFDVRLGILWDDGTSTTTWVTVKSAVDVPHVLRLSATAGTALQPITWLFPAGLIDAPSNKIPLQNVQVTVGEAVITQDNVASGLLSDLIIGELATVVLIDTANNLGAICTDIEVEAAG